MSNKKNTGSYYTPKILSDFLTKHITQNYLEETNISILEPSSGDGRFISSLLDNISLNSNHNLSIDLLDINKEELNKALDLIPRSGKIQAKAYCKNYLKFFLEKHKKYSLIIGNPPYVKRKNLQEAQVKSCDEVHEKFRDSNDLITSKGKVNNIWIAFVEAAIMSLNRNGILCFVIPSEVLQVKYAKELRAIIVNEFDRVEVFAFNELIFEGIQQDVVALIGIKGIDNTKEHGFSFYQVDELEDLKEPRFTEKHSNIHRTTLDKWTNYILTDEELNFIDGYQKAFRSIKYYSATAQVGIVSAANDYFIVNDETLINYKLNRLKNIVKPILPKGYVVPNLVSFCHLDFAKLKNENKNVNFLHFPNQPKKRFGKIANQYFYKGEEEREDGKGELHKRYKMQKREHWYNVPSVWASEGMFIKRSHLYPKIFVNESEALATDSFYRINAKDEYDIRKIVFSFYNSLTFVLAELEGRFYGGGVLELTPNEFKNLAIPYSDKISEQQFSKLDTMFRNDEDIESILKYTNSILLPGYDVNKLEEIRKVLVNRRIKKVETDSQEPNFGDPKMNNNEVYVEIAV
ncbi:Eco57I restriction-modification methylase domain-containing protein [Aureisphaera galaxeae]|uniref:Eco57I restriction-modification methylase domain-containing protein n=1 Tax=Aureisphaera galaxeae TaxID=1538023 RepID=UPI00235096B3|nr:N-6 DNA methylase [Aureisphaera galaxeae]MDC8004247.1 Eco57I restriction-modification methylase domain-containing protein [Aureisphaera galaxeae]